MRADRLLSLLMLLQARGKTPARKLAEELGVSERTIYRDVEALSVAGVPVYGERGPGGGVALVEQYRTDLTGMNEDEARALFMLNIPAPLAKLGVSQELKTALLKLAAALPAGRRREQDWVRQRIHLDSSWWFQDEPAPHLHTLHRAVWEDRRLQIRYRHEHFQAETERVVEPYALAAKASVWYLAAAHGGAMRVYRVSRVVEARLCAERFERRADFDLATFWAGWCEELERSRPNYPVKVRAAPELWPLLPFYFGDEVRAQAEQAGSRDEAGWMLLELRFERLEDARDRLLGLGRAVEVLEPEALRLSLVDVAQQIVAFYASRPPAVPTAPGSSVEHPGEPGSRAAG